MDSRGGDTWISPFFKDETLSHQPPAKEKPTMSVKSITKESEDSITEEIDTHIQQDLDMTHAHEKYWSAEQAYKSALREEVKRCAPNPPNVVTPELRTLHRAMLKTKKDFNYHADKVESRNKTSS